MTSRLTAIQLRPMHRPFQPGMVAGLVLLFAGKSAYAIGKQIIGVQNGSNNLRDWLSVDRFNSGGWYREKPIPI